jgi:hypothetical protein
LRATFKQASPDRLLNASRRVLENVDNRSEVRRRREPLLKLALKLIRQEVKPGNLIRQLKAQYLVTARTKRCSRIAFNVAHDGFSCVAIC